MEYFSCLSDMEWELIHVNSELVIAKIQQVEDAKRAEKREREMSSLAEFQTMEIKMMLEEKEAVMIEKLHQNAELTRERMELAEFEMLERQFENEEKLAALEKELQEERCQKYVPARVQQNISSTKNDVMSSFSGHHHQQQQQHNQKNVESQKEHTGILSNKQNNNNNNIIKKVRFVGLDTESTDPADVFVEQHKDTGIRKSKPISKIPKPFKVRRRNQ